MNPLNLDDVYEFVNTYIMQFHEKRLDSIKKANLKELVKKKNPYLFRSKNISREPDYVSNILDSFLASQEETMFGEFLETLAIFISSKTDGGYKSSIKGVDLEFIRGDTFYLVQIKSGTNWGNSAQQEQLRTHFEEALPSIQSQYPSLSVQPVIGCCYGKKKKDDKNGILKLCGQNFWYFISNNPNLYIEIIEPIGYESKKYNDDFIKAKDNLFNQLSLGFMQQFCLPNGAIDWEKLIQFNSKNLPSPS